MMISEETLDARDALRGIALLDERDREVHATLDVEAWSALWTDDVVILPPGRSAAVGRAAAMAALRRQLSQGQEHVIIDWTPIWEETVLAGDLAFQRGCIRYIGADSAGQDEVGVYFNVLRVLRREPSGDWRIHRLCWNEATRTPLQLPSRIRA